MAEPNARLVAGLAACALLALSGGLRAEDTATPPAWDFVEFQVNVWGVPTYSWRMLPNGGGSWTEAVNENPPPSMDYSLAWHEIEPDPANYAALEAILRRLPDPAPDPQACTNFMTDQAYGTIRLTRGATTTEIAWNSGCRDDDYMAFMDVLKEADSHVQALGKAAPVSRVEPASRP